MKNVLVTGATGFIGRLLINRLVGLGYSVRAFVRTGSDLSVFPPGVDFYEGDLFSEKDLRKACENIDIIFHLAARLHISNPDPSEEKEIMRVNLDITRFLCRAAWKEGVSRFIFFSTINVYGPSCNSTPFDEHSPLKPETAYAKSKLEAERYVLGLRHRDSGLAAGVVLRLSAVHGANMKGNYRLLSGLAGAGLRLVPGDLKNRRTVIHQSDAVEAAIIAASHAETPGKVFNLTDGRCHELEAIYSSMLKYHGHKPSVIKMRARFSRQACELLDCFCRLLGFRPLFVSRLDKFNEDMAADGSAFMRVTGFKPAFGLFDRNTPGSVICR